MIDSNGVGKENITSPVNPFYKRGNRLILWAIAPLLAIIFLGMFEATDGLGILLWLYVPIAAILLILAIIDFMQGANTERRLRDK